jgi:hypothetical protein
VTIVTGRTQAANRLRNEADAAWHRYHSTVCTGGTPEQRQWAFNTAAAAEEKAAAIERTIPTR